MAKRGSKKGGKRTSRTTHSPISKSNRDVEKILIENFVSLQKVMTNLSLKFEDLSKQISKLLELFELSAKTIAKKDFSGGGMESKKIAEKLDNLLEQNKTIARGLTLLHEAGKGVSPQPQQVPLKNLEKLEQRGGVQDRSKEVDAERYQKSISSPRGPEQRQNY
jgi:hypothetical protein